MKVTLIAALTADGYIGKDEAHLSTRWTSREDGRFFGKISKESGHMVLGSKTFATFNRLLPDRKMYVYSRKKNLENPYKNNFEVVTESPSSLVERLDTEGVAELVICGGASIYTQFMQAGVVNRMLLTYEPVVFGKGIGLFSDAVNAKLQLTQVHNLSSQTKVHEYEVIHD